MNVSSTNVAFKGNYGKIGQKLGNTGKNFVQGCVDFASKSQKIMENGPSILDESVAGKAVGKLTKSSFAKEFVDGFVNTYKYLGAATIEAGKGIVSKLKK